VEESDETALGDLSRLNLRDGRRNLSELELMVFNENPHLTPYGICNVLLIPVININISLSENCRVRQRLSAFIDRKMRFFMISD
jgi:hypothetical protein